MDEQRNVNPAELPFLSTIGFMLTYKCTIACPHCVVEAGPHRKEEIAEEKALMWISQARKYQNGQIRGIALTGGEPFYNIPLLKHIADVAASQGFIVSVVTNGFWAKTKEDASRTLADLKSISMFSISTDIHHQKFIPFSHIKNAIEAMRENNSLYNIAVVTDSENDPGYLDILEDCKAIGEADSIRLSITFPVGRAKKKAASFNYEYVDQPTVAACTMGGSPIVFPDGSVIACIGPLLTLHTNHPLLLGNLNTEPLSEILDRAQTNPVLHAIRVWGPHKLVSFLKENEYEGTLPKTYIKNCICDVCFQLFSNESINNRIKEILSQEQNRQTVAYARAYYLNETGMMDALE